MKSNVTTFRSQLAWPILTGGLIALAIASFFVFSADGPKPEWGSCWMVKPLILTPLAGAFGGLLYGLIGNMRKQGKMNPVLAVVLGVMVYLVVLWIGIVLGLNGTMWD